MQIDRKDIEAALRTKGFVEDGGDHKYFHHEVNGKRTGVSTFTSRGSGYKVYGVQLLGLMKKQLRLNNMKQVKDFLECPMSETQYNSILREKGIF